MNNIDDRTAIELTADIVSAYVGNNPLPAAGLPDLIASVSASVRKLAGASAVKESVALTPAVNPKRSVFPDYIVCLEDGKKFKSLKRHLSTDHGLTSGRIPRQMGPGARLSDGGAQLFGDPLGAGEVFWSRPQACRGCSGQGGEAQGQELIANYVICRPKRAALFGRHA